jgi:serine protease Do
MAKELLPQLKTGKVIRGWLGVMIQDITPELAESFGLKDAKGVLISDVVEGSPADKAGLETGDIVVEFNGEPVENAHDLSRKVAATRPETTVKIGILRDGSRRTIKLQLGTMPDEEMVAGPAVEESSWGMSVQNLTEELASRFGWDPSERGVIITDVEPGSPAAEAKLLPGDLIKEVNRKKIQNLRDYNQAVKKGEKKRSLLLLIKRGEHTFYVVLQAQEE